MRAVDPDPRFDTDPATAVPGQYLVTFDDSLSDDAGYTPETTAPTQPGGTTRPGGNTSSTQQSIATPVDDDWANTGDEPTVPSAVTTANSIAAAYGTSLSAVYDSVGVFLVNANETTARATSHDPRVVCVVSDDDNPNPGGSVQVTPSYNPDQDNWGLDRLDERDTALPSKSRDNRFRYAKTGLGVHAYVIDSGIYIDHEQFEGRADWAYSAVPGESPDDKYHEHGTAVASCIGGRSFGPAKDVYLHAVKAWGEYGVRRSRLIRAFNWVRKHAQKPAVANCSLYMEKFPKWLDNLVNWSGPVERAWRRMIGSGVMATTCANNFNNDTDRYVPSGTSRGFTIAATRRDDTKASFSCYDSGVDPLRAWRVGRSRRLVHEKRG